MSLSKIGPIFVDLPPLIRKYYNENPINRIQDYFYLQNLYEVSPQY